FWLLACGPSVFRTHLFPAFTAVRNTGILPVRPAELKLRWAHRLQVCVPSPNDWLVGNRIQLQQRNCSGFTPDFSRRSTVLNSQRTKRAIAACASPFKIYLVRRVFRAHFSSASN